MLKIFKKFKLIFLVILTIFLVLWLIIEDGFQLAICYVIIKFHAWAGFEPKNADKGQDAITQPRFKVALDKNQIM